MRDDLRAHALALILSRVTRYLGRRVDQQLILQIQYEANGLASDLRRTYVLGDDPVLVAWDADRSVLSMRWASDYTEQVQIADMTTGFAEPAPVKPKSYMEIN